MNDRVATSLVLVDGTSYLYRAFYALPPLSTANGQPTGAVYGVVNMLRKLISDYAPRYMAVVFDAKGKTFREELYPDYKVNRPPMPPELDEQIEPLHAVIRAMGIPLLVVPGVEADDVIGTLALQAQSEGMRVVISTGDKDLAQLVSEQITLVNTMTGAVLDPGGVLQKFGVPPQRIADYLALVGDSVDNIPGVPKVGPKTAKKWLAEHESLDVVMAHADQFKGKVGENLRASLDQLALSRELATVRCDVDLECTPPQLRLSAPQQDTLRELFERLEFRAWLKELLEGEGASGDKPVSASTAQYESILSWEAFERWFAKLNSSKLFAFDTETTSLDYLQAQVVGVSFAVETGAAAYLPFGHDYPGAPQQLNGKAVLERLKPLLESPARHKLGHHLKYDRNVLANHGILLNGIGHDTMLESYVLNSTASSHDLDTLCQRHLQHTNIRYEDVAGKGSKQLTFNQVPLERATPYAAEDADMTLRLHHHLWPQLQASAGQRAVYAEIEIPLVEVLSRMERSGVKVDAEWLHRHSQELGRRLDSLEQRIYLEAGQTFNIGSPKQIQEILFDKMGLPVVRKTPKGQPSTAEDVLQELSLDFPLPRLILEHRSLSKLRSTYTDRLPSQINPATGRVHTSYHQAVASTGRLSSSDPNLQNIPIRTEEGRRIRQAFVAPEGRKILAADYSQIELRIMAHLSGDGGLLRAFEQGLDIHRATAAEVFGTSPEQVSDDQRRAAKAINFGLIYGMSAFGLARQLGIDRGAAQQYVERYFARYPGVKGHMERTRREARERGFVETVFGRRLYLPEINSRNNQRRQYAERTAINAPMQGTAADIIKRAMIAVDRWIQHSAPPLTMIMQVHDELVFEVETDAVAGASSEIRTLMEGAAALKVPLRVDIGVGNNWEEAH